MGSVVPIEKARAKRAAYKARRAAEAKGLRPVRWEDVVTEADADCRRCLGDGFHRENEDHTGDWAVCRCAEENFQRRRAAQVTHRKEGMFWLEGCPRG